MSNLTPICVLCRLEMRCVKNNRLVRDPSTDAGPSTYWLGDEFQCPVCSIRIVTGFGKPLESDPGLAYGEALQFDYERPPALMLHLELQAGSGPQNAITGYIPLRLPPGMDIAGIDLGGPRSIPLLAFGDVQKPIALLTVSSGGPRVLKAVGRGEGPDCVYARPFWAALLEGTASAFLCLRDLRSTGEELELWAISLELAGPDRAAQTRPEGHRGEL